MTTKQHLCSQSLSGTRLSLNSRGIYDWRCTDAQTGRRMKRSTGERALARALRKAQQFAERRAYEDADLRRDGVSS